MKDTLKNFKKSKEKITLKKETPKKKEITKKTKITRSKDGTLHFSDKPEFTPNLTPREIFLKGSFGGTYFRQIHSDVVSSDLKNVHKKYSILKGIQEDLLSSIEYDKEKNKYKVVVGTSLEFWEQKKWINKEHPYGWVHWYCDFYSGKRSEDDDRQIKRWNNLAGENGRFRKYLITLLKKKNKDVNDYSVSPKIRQTLQHWAFELKSLIL